MSKIEYKKIKITDENRDTYADYRKRYERNGPTGLIFKSISHHTGFRRGVRVSDEYIHEFSASDWKTLVEFTNGIKKQIGITDDWVEAFAKALAI